MLSGSTIDTFEARAERVTLNRAISVVSNLLGKDLYISSNRPLPIYLSPGQTIATCQRNILQHCWAQHVACVWPPCLDMLGVVDSDLKMVKFEPTTPNTSQPAATRWPNARNMLGPTMLRHVALACCDRLAGALHSHEIS